jgi:hypothetical protein
MSDRTIFFASILLGAAMFIVGCLMLATWNPAGTSGEIRLIDCRKQPCPQHREIMRTDANGKVIEQWI